ncbi:MAG: AAA family ATPase, partial [Chitinispirillaceae bacterium]|nr:AAA family ATPase [Chitinispirillaceae bacterium]
MYYRISEIISPQELIKYLKVTYAIDDFDIRVASFFSNHIYKIELKEDTQILLLLLLSTVKKGQSRAHKEDLMSIFNTNIEDNELYSLLLEEGMERNKIENFLSKGISNIKERVEKWIDYLFESESYNAMEPIIGKSINSLSFSQPLVICDPEKRAFWFQAYYISEKLLEKEGNYLLSSENNPIEKKKVASILNEIVEKEFQGKTPHIRQLAAIILSLLKRVIVISGGPGTGKSSLVSLILKALIKYYNIPLEKIAISAPTGRAKSRLLEAIKNSSDNSFSNLSAYTIHSLLGIGSNAYLNEIFPYKEKLPYKLIVVDEVSMVDIRLFAGLIERISSDCRLILVGDTEQLPPVDAGAVLGNLNFIKGNNLSSLSVETVDIIKNILELCNFNFDKKELSSMITEIKSKIVDHIVFLTKNYRSDTQIIDWWSNFVSCGRVPATNNNNSCMIYLSKREIGYNVNNRIHLESLLKEWVGRWYESYSVFKEMFAEKLLFHKEVGSDSEIVSKFSKLISRMRILCCRNEGLQGRIFINETCKSIFWTLKGKKGVASPFYDGIPIIITRNQYNIELYNGDTGIVLEYKGKLYACFVWG